MQVSTISEQLFFTTIRIDTISRNGDSGSGTGFFFCHKKDNIEYLSIVTNKHVIENTVQGTLTFLKGKDNTPALGDGFSLNIKNPEWEELWFGHPDEVIDIAICPLVPLLDFIKNNTALIYLYDVSRHR
ncbi:hypothetical protein LEG54_03465 [Salmonella enterica]|nr:hypothetical protein [Salmonella enterica]MCQ7733807.1 hypothetical protein [Salmonella enterica]MCQ7739158.1 hypothetical protein [Salmonella enterica]MDJ9087860.1 hypothetical protein [Salmonella enterica]